MTSEELEAAAQKLDSDATRFCGDVAQQLVDRAAELRSHAFTAQQFEKEGKAVPAEMAERHERNAREFLRMAGRRGSH